MYIEAVVHTIVINTIQYVYILQLSILQLLRTLKVFVVASYGGGGISVPIGVTVLWVVWRAGCSTSLKVPLGSADSVRFLTAWLLV